MKIYHCQTKGVRVILYHYIGVAYRTDKLYIQQFGKSLGEYRCEHALPSALKPRIPAKRSPSEDKITQRAR